MSINLLSFATSNNLIYRTHPSKINRLVRLSSFLLICSSKHYVNHVTFAWWLDCCIFFKLFSFNLHIRKCLRIILRILPREPWEKISQNHESYSSSILRWRTSDSLKILREILSKLWERLPQNSERNYSRTLNGIPPEPKETYFLRSITSKLWERFVQIPDFPTNLSRLLVACEGLPWNPERFLLNLEMNWYRFGKEVR